MIDAYEIGIRLALDNGVSEGLAVIRRDLIALDAAIAHSAAGLAALQQLAGGLAAPVLLPQRSPAPPAEKLPLVQPLAPELKSPNQPNPAPPAPVVVSQAPKSSGSPNEVAPSRPAAPVLLPTSAPTAPSSPRSRPEQGAAPARRPEPAGAAMTDDAPSARPTAPVPARDPAGPRSALPPVLPSLPPVAPSQPSRAAPLPTARHTRPAEPSSTHAKKPAALRELRAVPTLSLAPVQRMPVQPKSTPRKTSFAPTSAAAPTGRLRAATESSPGATPLSRALAVPDEPTATKSRSAAADQMEPRWRAGSDSTGTETRPNGGDIYLEGAVIGRWVADRLARAAGRPVSGGTAFDPRVSPNWPGASIGG